jgi:hypothetical protein
VYAALLAVLIAAPQQHRGHSMTDELFWSADPAAALEDVPLQRGLELLAPAQVDLARRATLPVVVRRKVSMRDDARAPLPRFAALLAVDLDRNLLYTDLAVATRDDGGRWAAPDEAALAQMRGDSSQALTVDLRERLGVPWRAGELMVVAVVGSQRSAARRISLTGPSPRSADARASRERDAQDVSWERSPQSPPLPAANGIALAAAGQKLTGAYRLPVSEADRKAGWVAIHLVFCGHAAPWPLPVRLRAKANSPVAEGSFALDVSAQNLSASQPFTVWAVSRDSLSEPAGVP